MSFLNKLRTKIFQKPAQPIMPTQLYTYKTRFAMLGPTGSGKTTVSAMLVLAAQVLSSDMPTFRCRVLEGTSSILDAVSHLRQGHFPPKTTAHMRYAAEAGLLMRQKTSFGERKIQVPIVDIAGEDIDILVAQYSRTAQNIAPVAYSLAQNLVNYVRECDGYILCVDSSRALGIKGYSMPSDEVQEDPDVYLTRVLNSIFTYKEQSHGKPIKGIAVVITKWDTIESYAPNWGMDIYDPTGRGLDEFMHTCFPQTSMTLKDHGFGFGANIRVFPSYIHVERNSDGTPKTWKDGTPRIIIKHRRIPDCDLQSYVDLIDFLLGFAT
ncbi:MAG: hypothetical protein DRJ03_04105 [Chloroflexi bacterium]|nr:MAG: hypothetical protein DRJ03_04105 [Chloroflexota bacterium]